MDDRAKAMGFDFLYYLTSKFEENSIKYWLDFGTLLGCVRDEKCIEDDLDFDIGVWYEDRWKVKDIVMNHYMNFKWMHCEWRDSYCMWNLQPYTKDYLCQTMIDIYYYKKYKNGAIACPSVYAESEDEYWSNIEFAFSNKSYYLNNFTYATFEGKKFKVPKYKKDYVKRLYGDDCLEDIILRKEGFNDRTLDSSKGPPKVTAAMGDSCSDQTLKRVRETFDEVKVIDKPINSVIKTDFMDKNNIDFLVYEKAKDTFLNKWLSEPLSEGRVILLDK